MPRIVLKVRKQHLSYVMRDHYAANPNDSNLEDWLHTFTKVIVWPASQVQSLIFS